MKVSGLALTLVLVPSTLLAQAPSKKSPAKPAVTVAATAADPKLKGVWEAVSYPADVYLNDVYFATPEVGWVTAGAHGKPGMVIHTKDGGASWTVQVGDPESNDPAFHHLHFIDARTGWVLQGDKLLHTSDGESWSQTGSIERQWGLADYTFISPREGLYIDGNDNVSRIMRSADGGRTWSEVYKCAATIQAEGLTKKVQCALKTLHFPTPRVGYALGGAHGAKRTLFVAKTEDGGETWKLSIVPDVGGDNEVYGKQEAFFTDEATGVVSLSDNRIYRTTDGGRSWKGVVGTPGPVIRFADPLVGWSFPSYRTLSYTTDGGNRWSTREFAFPTKVTAFSLPRRDRAFVVGEHGMIYRYRVLPPGSALAAKGLAAPAMPVFDSPLDERVGELDQVVDALESAVAAAPDSAPADGAAAATPEVNSPEAADMEEETAIAADEVVEEDVTEVEVGAEVTETDATEVTEAEVTEAEVTEADVAEAEVEEIADVPAEGGTQSAFTAGCCAKPLGKFDLILAAVTDIVPQFLGQYKNTNLLLAGLRMVTDLPGRISKLNNALRTFRKAPDKAAAQARVAQVAAAVQGLSQSIAIAFQKQPSAPVGDPGEADAGAGVVEASSAVEVEIGEDAGEADSGSSDQAAGETQSDDGLVEEAARVAEQEAKEKAKKGAKKAIKKKLRF
jgi:photosystem II stability/assembly factor-like uncharacterized protein